MLPRAYEKMNVLFFFLKLEWFRNGRYVLLLNEYYFHKKTDRFRGDCRICLELSHGVFLWAAYTGIIFFLGRGFPEAVTMLLI